MLKTLGALGWAAMPGSMGSVPAVPRTAADAGGDYCSTNSASRPLFVPSADGWFGRLAPAGAPLTMRASTTTGAAGPWTHGYVVEHRGTRFVNPTLVVRRGERVRIDLENALEEPTIVHWHGLAVDIRNDGAATMPIAPRQRYSYSFDVRDRGSLYWYHPHPHGLTAGQVYRGMFGLIEVGDEDERALRGALDLVPGKSEIPLILQDRRGAEYAATDPDRMHGWFGKDVYVNGTVRPYLEVASRIYRFRVLNASNARSYRLGLRTADGKAVSFTLIGTDAGLLAVPRRCDEAFLATAERIDILVDLSDAAVGDTILLETRAFDPMHMEMAAPSAAIDHAAMGHMMASPPAGAANHAAMGHSGSFPEGTLRTLLQLRVRERIAYRATIPQRLSTVAPIDTGHAAERPLRLGFAKGRWRINDRVFAMGETPIEVKRDTVHPNRNRLGQSTGLTMQQAASERCLTRDRFNLAWSGSVDSAVNRNGYAGRITHYCFTECGSA